MFHEVDKTLEFLLDTELPAAVTDQVSMSFAAPDNQFPPSSVSLPVINLFLYDIREDRELRSNDWEVNRHSADKVTRIPPPARIGCSYLVTAWASDSSSSPAHDEHFLLGEAMRVFLRHPVIPIHMLQGTLKDQTRALPLTSLQTTNLQSLGEFWQALGGKPKAAFSVTVTIEVPTQPPSEPVPLAVDRQFRLRQGVDQGNE